MTKNMTETTENSLVLTDAELKELTEYKHRAKQQQRLAHMGIPFKIGRFGRPIVLRDAAVESLGGKIRMGKGTFDVGPDFEALAAVQNGS